MNEQVLKDLLSKANEMLADEYELYGKAHIPNLEGIAEKISLNLPEECYLSDDKVYDSYMNAVRVFLLRQAINMMASVDADAYQYAFGVSVIGESEEVDKLMAEFEEKNAE